MQVRFIAPEETHPLRQQVLRPGQPLAHMEWPLDHAPGSFHLGMDVEGRLCSVASFVPQGCSLPGSHTPYRLRGMATVPAHQGSGFGTALLRFGIGHARQLRADLLWCNARERAVPFYARQGFVAEGQPFPIEHIGVHQLMYVRL